ncbi:flippase [Patescibacteria group bacterium]|nr:flippase [Patescibacteria group bacterium]
MATIRQKIAYNVTFSATARIIETFLALVIVGLLTRYLGKSDFGDYITVLNFWYIFSVLADWGLYSITVREISRNSDREKEIISNAFTLRIVSASLVFFIGVIASFFLPYSGQIKTGIILASFGFWALLSSQVLMGLFQKKLRIDRVAIAEIISRIFQFFLIVALIKYGLGFSAIIAVVSLTGIANLLLNLWFAGKFVRIRPAFNYALWKKFISEGWPLAIAAVFVMLYFRLNILILSFLKGSDAVGIFGLSYKILENLIFLPAMFVGLLMPMMSVSAKENMEKFKAILQKAFDALVVFLVPLAGFTLVLSDKIIYLIAGKNFSESAGVLNILIFAAALIFPATLWSNAIIALGKQKQLLKIYFFGVILSVGANTALTAYFSYTGTAIATLATEFLVTLLMFIYLKSEIGYRPLLGRARKAIVAALISSVVVWYLGKAVSTVSVFVSLPLLLLSGIGAYFLLLYFLNGISPKELVLIFKNADNEK